MGILKGGGELANLDWCLGICISHKLPRDVFLPVRRGFDPEACLVGHWCVFE
jgi:hypothetical protein